MNDTMTFWAPVVAIGLVVSIGASVSASETVAGRSSYPQTNLSTKALKATLYLPDAEKGYYRGTRFDWSGLVSRVEYGGHTFFSEFKQEHDPLNHDDICGTADEFGIESAPSFSQAKPGEPFIKIGIGVLERPDDSPYAFWKRYKIRTPGAWSAAGSSHKINFRQKLQGPDGWDYDYAKTVSLASGGPELKIARKLKNTGTQTIETDQYDHNFLRIDDIPAGTNYTLEFNFAPRLGQDSRTQGYVEVRDHSLVFTREPSPDKAIWVRLEGFGGREDNSIKIVNHASGAAMIITTDQPLSKLVFYSSGGVLCPEPFVKVSIPPGQTKAWTTTYRFETVPDTRPH